MQDKKTLIFDFDGTIADSLGIVVEFINEVGKGWIGTIAPELVAEYRKLTAFQILKKTHVPLWKLPGLRAKGIKVMRARIGDITPFAGMPEVLKQLAAQYRLIILTSNAVANSQSFLKNHGLEEYFDGVYTATSIFRKDFAIHKVLVRQKLQKKDVLYIGDEVRDVEAAHKAGIGIIAVTWGYNDKSILQIYKPTVMVDAPAELPGAVAKLLQ